MSVLEPHLLPRGEDVSVLLQEGFEVVGTEVIEIQHHGEFNRLNNKRYDRQQQKMVRLNRTDGYLDDLGFVTAVSSRLPEEANELNIEIVRQACDLTFLLKHSISLQRL